MSDKHRQKQLFQAMKQKHLGLGTEATTTEEWMTHVHRDTYYSLASHSSMLEYLALSQGDSSKRVTELRLIEKMCGGLSSKRARGENRAEIPFKQTK
ncbi:U2 snRNP complex subunit YSF3 [Lachancea thermotolerans CBS 6340]|uniref:KLTH0B05764p n=1 Tax=Lachancea thermotolerans (strain ATCC 56472 / CBS 6340 / NRRL Y-8284) TaxID=559295 RepID=C5DCT9_LACTC|nr:KLTH0B05764p [Lachancea thermotolerans CBS 6340]CAR21600.1 KLTH0B05764p [Lachancea thermotolerans CBS 6340]